MGKISATQRLIVEDFPDQKDWIGKMFYVINDFFQKSLATVNGSISFAENITGLEKDFDFIYSTTASSLPLNVKWNLSKPPKSCQVVAAYSGATDTDYALISNKKLIPCMCAIAWEYTQDGSISITDFNILNGVKSTSVGPVVGQRIVIRIRATP